MPIVEHTSPNYETEPEYTSFIEALIQKTKEGKLNWQETAQENTFIAAVKGQQTFEICEISGYNQEVGEQYSYAVITVKDSKGKVLFQTPEKWLAPASRLFELAKRVGQRVDERLQTSVQLLKSL